VGWPNGFVCPRCGNQSAYELVKLKRCCRRQVSVTAQTILGRISRKTEVILTMLGKSCTLRPDRELRALFFSQWWRSVYYFGMSNTKCAPFLLLSEKLIPLNSPDGRQLLQESHANESFWALIQYYSSQPDLGSCSVASCTMVLNALTIARPVSKQHGRFKLFTADNLFSPEVEKIISRKRVSTSGMCLHQLNQVLASYGIQVSEYYASASTANEFRSLMRIALRTNDSFIIVNYLRDALEQESGGHISPIGAFSEKADCVLILDTANYKYPWIWVKTNELWKAMSEEADSASGLSRGFLLLSPPKS
jgi:Phytochelatin synthase